MLDPCLTRANLEVFDFYCTISQIDSAKEHYACRLKHSVKIWNMHESGTQSFEGLVLYVYICLNGLLLQAIWKFSVALQLIKIIIGRW